jgi:hypothetical protein
MGPNAKHGIYHFLGANQVELIMGTHITVLYTSGAMLKINHAKALKKIPVMEKRTYSTGKSAQNIMHRKLKRRGVSHTIDIYI